eukprot:12075116-Heterocapsa_arctica.AAC.1
MPPSVGRVLDLGSSARLAQARPPLSTSHATPAGTARNTLPPGPSTMVLALVKPLHTPRKRELTPALQDVAPTRHHTPGVLDL